MASAATKPRVRIGTDGSVRGAYVEGELVRPGRPSSAYMRGGASPFFFNWNPALREQRDEVFYSYSPILVQNIIQPMTVYKAAVFMPRLGALSGFSSNCR